MSTIIAWLQDTFGLSPQLQGRILSSFVAIVLLWTIRRVVLIIIWRQVEDVRGRYRVRKVTMYITVLVGIIVVGRIWFEGLQSIATFLGLLSAGVAIALKDLLVNLAGWGFILWRRPFEVGDRIEVGDFAGDVIDLRIFQFTLMEIGNWVDAEQSTGRVVHVPNGIVLGTPLANYSKGFQYIWNEIPVMVTFESNWRRAKKLLREIADRHGGAPTEQATHRVQKAAERFLISYSTLTPTVYTSVADSGVTLTLRYLCNPRERRGTTEAVWEDILDEFGRADDIDFAYPTQRFYDNVVEGKSGARASTAA